MRYRLNENPEDLELEAFQNRLKLIEAFSSKLSLAGVPSDFKKMAIIRRIAAFIYSEIYGNFISRFNENEAMEHLRNLGSRVADSLYKVFKIPSNKYLEVKLIFPEIAKQLFGVNLKVVDIKKEKENKIVQKAILQVKNCILCTGLPPIENTKIHYCLPIEAFYENFYNLIAAAHPKMKPQYVQIRTIQSVGGGAKTCDYEMTTIKQSINEKI